MNPAEWFKIFAEVGQSTNGGFTVIALLASVACWIVYRGTRATLVELKKDLKACTDKHEATDKQIGIVYRKAENLAISCASLWTIINMSGDRRGYQLPPLNEVLEGRMVIQIRAGHPQPGDARAINTPLVFTEDTGATG